MRFEIEIAAFTERGRDALALLDVLLCGAEGRHTVVIDPPLRTSTAAREAFRAWRSALLVEGGVLAVTLTEHYERKATRSDRVQLRNVARVVAARDSMWSAEPPRVTPRDASRLAREPLSIILEDAVNDGAFLRVLSEVADESGSRFREYLGRAWLRIAHGGGIDSIPRLLRALEEVQIERRRCVVMVDHDGDTPKSPSQSSSRVEEVCEDLRVPFIRLRRRAIENYAPREALERWARGELFVLKEVRNRILWKRILHEPGEEIRADRAEVLKKWSEINDEIERCHCPMKDMFSSDIAERVFSGFIAGKDRGGDGPEPVRFVVQPEWLRRNACAQEAGNIVETLLRSA